MELHELYILKMSRIIDNSDYTTADSVKDLSSKVKNWLLCEWQCDAIPDMSLYNLLVSEVDEIIRLHGNEL